MIRYRSMRSPHMVVIEMQGMLYCISKTGWHKLLCHIAEGGDKGICEFGGKCIGVIQYVASDLEEDLARALLEQGE